MTILDLNATIAGVSSSGHLCICPGNYSEVCPSVTAEPAIVINGGQDIILECVAGNSSTDACIFGCPGVIAHVKGGGALTLLGNAAMEMTGGVVYSRLVVEEGAVVNMTAVNFMEYVPKESDECAVTVRALCLGAQEGVSVPSDGWLTYTDFSSLFCPSVRRARPNPPPRTVVN